MICFRSFNKPRNATSIFKKIYNELSCLIVKKVQRVLFFLKNAEEMRYDSRELLSNLSDELLGKLSNELLGKLSDELLGKLSNELLSKLSDELLGKLSNELLSKLSDELLGM